jgi:5'-nucleotidase
MEILITNDDGIYADGIYALYDSLRKTARVTVVAPDIQRSAVGHAITLTDPLRVTEVRRYGKFFGYATSGTPADCVKLAIRAIMKKKPDLVFSGINLGANMGYNVLYSGTVSGATEGALLGIPSVAISLDTFTKPDFSYAAAFARKIAVAASASRLPPGTLLNINVPAISAGRIKGVSITRQSRTLFNDRFDKRTDPHGQTYYWLTGSMNQKDTSPDSDLSALRRNRVSITPLQFDLTDYKSIDELADWEFGAPKLR